MKQIGSILVVLVALSLPMQSLAQTPECGQLCGKMREAVADLGRIVAPNGVQETYKTRIGGIDRWINIRGQDRDNPMILFVHGGPTAWQFQRPIEEYFTVVHYDQRGAGKVIPTAFSGLQK